MHTKALYYVFADIFVPFFVNLAHFQQELHGYQPHLVSFTPRERAILKKNGQRFSPGSLAEIEEQPETTVSLGDADVTELFAFMQMKHKGTVTEWKRRTVKIANYLDSYIAEKGINLIIVWNGQDHVARSLTEIAKKRKIRMVYMENGYFSNTLQADTCGVNMSASICSLTFDQITDAANQAYKETKSDSKVCKMQRIIGLSKIDHGTNFFKRVINLQFYKTFPELRGSSWFKKRKLEKSRLAIPLDTINLPSEYAFLPLQVHDDTQILINSPHFKDPKKFIRHCYQEIRLALGNDYPIVVKEHPEDFLRYDYEDIKAEFPDIIWLRKFDIEKLLDNAKFIAVINSSVGLQAIAKEKPVIVYGESIYSRGQICYFISDLSESRNAISKAIQPVSEARRQDIKTFLNFINSHFFFKGSWKNITFESITECAQRINQLVHK